MTLETHVLPVVSTSRTLTKGATEYFYAFDPEGKRHKLPTHMRHWKRGDWVIYISDVDDTGRAYDDGNVWLEWVR